MNTRLRLLTTVLPVAAIAGMLGAQPAASEPDKAAPDKTSAAPAAPQTAPAPGPYAATYQGHVTVHQDRTATDLFTRKYKILTPVAINLVSQQHETYVDGMERLTIIEAYTEKADGTKIPVDAGNIITRDAASGLEATFTRDLKQRTVIFQDVEVGDTLVLTLQKDTLNTVFPGQFFYADVFPRTVPMESAEIVVDAPAALDLHVKALGAGLHDRIEDAAGTAGQVRHVVTLEKRALSLGENRSVAAIDVDPLLLISTFDSYPEMGRAYAQAALPKGAVTLEITALADEITQGIAGRREQAIAIDAWMKKNIRYVAVYLAAGRVVPNDAASVLRNRFGDCKDKVTLMSALLAAEGIASEHALISFGGAYTLPEPPTMVALNHVIMYLPEFDLYTDPTAQMAGFGVLTAETYDKPVVRVSAGGAILARTPTMKPREHVADVHTTLTVAADGTISGRTVEQNTGVLGMALRGAAAAVQIVGNDTLAQRQLQSVNIPGKGHFDLANTGETAEPARIEASFTLNQKFKAPAQNGRASIPVGLSLMVRPGNFLLGTLPNNRKIAFTCYAGRQVEEIDATFDESLPMPVAPAPVKIDNVAFSYSASFSVEERTFKIRREFVSHVEHQTCDPELEGRIIRDMNTLRNNLNINYVFRRPTPPAPAAPVADATPAATVTPIATTGPAPSPTPAPAPPAAVTGPKTLELTRVVAADQRLRLDFLYSINPDCSSVGFASVRVIEQPKHGRITVENSTGFTNFPASNPRVECNKRRSDGVTIFYDPEPGYVGTDSINFDAIFASGSLSKRHYAVEVR